MSNTKSIKMHFPVSVVVAWTKKWAEASKKAAETEPERAMLDDVKTMVEVAASVMVQKN
ncbi:MAG: hypothetical protein J6T35_01430 [Bacteroidales bacterium]|nr:hypothetical protein [Bacteroidales bacterium]